MANALGNTGSRLALRNLIKNSDFNTWNAGTSSVPDEWTLTGTGAVAREGTTIKGGLYSFKGTITSGNAVKINQTVHSEYGIAYFKGRVFILKAWVKTDTASKVRLQIDDGVGTTASSYHTGGNTWELLSVSRTLDASATKVDCVIDMADDATGYSAYVDLVVAGEFLTVNNDSNNSFFPGTSEPNNIILRKSASGADVASDKIDLFSSVSSVDKKMTIQQQGISSQEAIEILNNSGTRKHYFDGTGKYVSSGDISASTGTVSAQKLSVNQTAAADVLDIQDGAVSVLKLYDGGILDVPKQSAMLAYQPNATDTIATGTWTKVSLLSTEVFDIQSEYDNAVIKFTATKAGYYLCFLQALWDCTSIAYYAAAIWKNGTSISEHGISPGSTGWRQTSTFVFTNLAIGDYLEPYVYHDAGANRNIIGGNVKQTYMFIVKVM